MFLTVTLYIALHCLRVTDAEMLHPVRLLSVPAGAWRRLKRVATLYGVTERLRLKKNTAFWAILGCIWLYTLFVVASATVIGV